jgi:transcriptional regulator with XRE-family HTH domain
MTRAVPRSSGSSTKGASNLSAATPAVLSLSPAAQAREVLAALSMSKAQLAKVLRVSRPTLYDWFHDREPNVENSQRLSTLLRLLSAAGITSAEPLRPRFLRYVLNEGTPSLLDALCAEVLVS